MMDISTFIGATAPMSETSLKSTSPSADNSEPGDFIQLLEAILTEVELDDQHTENITQSTAWLGTLLHVFSQYSFGEMPTPDSSGEASISTEAGLSVSLTELMTALQTVPSQAGSTGLLAMTPAELGFLIEPENNSDIEQVLTIVRDQTTETLDPAALSSLQSLLTSNLPLNPISTSQALSGDQTGASSLPQTMAGFVELTAEMLPGNNPKATATGQPAPPATNSLPLKEGPVEGVFDTNLANAAASEPASKPAPAAGSPVALASDSANLASSNAASQSSGPTLHSPHTLSSAAETTPEAPFQPQPKVQAQVEGAVAVDPPVTTVNPPLTVVGKPVEGLELPDVPALKQIVDTVELITNRGETSVRLQLHPESLGRVTIQLHTTNGDVVMRVLTETAQAQTLIRDHLPELKAAFANQGLQLSNLMVAVGSDTSTFDQPRQGANGRPFEWADENQPGFLKKTSTATDPVRPQWKPGLGLNSINYQV